MLSFKAKLFHSQRFDSIDVRLKSAYLLTGGPATLLFAFCRILV